MAKPDDLLQFLLNRLYDKCTNPASALYLPKLILSHANPSADPYRIDASWNDIDLGPEAAKGATLICASTGPDDATPIPCGNPGTPRVAIVQATQANFPEKIPFEVAGLSNVILGRPQVTDGSFFRFSATFGHLTDWPIKSIAIRANFTCDQTCCFPAGASGDPGSQYNTHGEGTLVATLIAATATAEGEALATPDRKPRIRLDRIGFSAKTTDLSSAVVIYSLSQKDLRNEYSRTAQNLFNMTKTRLSILDQIEKTLSSSSVRQNIENAMNDVLAKL
jgi:hypothetical protein